MLLPEEGSASEISRAIRELLKIKALLSSEGIPDANSSYHLAVAQVFGPEHVTLRLSNA